MKKNKDPVRVCISCMVRQIENSRPKTVWNYLRPAPCPFIVFCLVCIGGCLHDVLLDAGKTIEESRTRSATSLAREDGDALV